MDSSKYLTVESQEDAVHAIEPSGPPSDAAEDALAKALAGATAAGRWDVVAQLAKELEARRLAKVGNSQLAEPRPLARVVRLADALREGAGS